MNKINALIFDSSRDKDKFLNNIFTELEARGFSFGYYFSQAQENFLSPGRLIKKAYLGRHPNGFFSRLIFFLSLPALRLAYFIKLFFVKIINKPRTVIMIGWNEKIILSPIVRLLRMKSVWIEKMDVDFVKKGFFNRWLYKINAKKSVVVVFSNFTKEKLLKIGVLAENIKVINQGIKIKPMVENKLVLEQSGEMVSSKFKNNFFTIGTVTDLTSTKGVEVLFQTIKTCSEFIPNIQLIVVGEGAEKKNLGWTAKQMGIDSLVWLVGEHGHMRKWLDSFDLYVVSSETLTMSDVDAVLKCMAAGLPVLAPFNKGLDDVILDSETGFTLKVQDSEALAAQIIKLYREQKTRLKLGQAGKKRVEEYFNLKDKIEEFQRII